MEPRCALGKVLPFRKRLAHPVFDPPFNDRSHEPQAVFDQAMLPFTQEDE